MRCKADILQLIILHQYGLFHLNAIEMSSIAATFSIILTNCFDRLLNSSLPPSGVWEVVGEC
jgi:hypothetical protein